MFREKPSLIVHIGLHKTGTTYLQTELFPRFKSVNLVRAWESHRKLLNPYSDKIILSDEGLSGNPLGGNYLNEFYDNIRTIKSIYKISHIIMGVREHSSFILSLYKQYLHQKGYQNIEYLYDKNGNSLLQDEDLFFEKRIVFLKTLFPNVFIYSQETIYERPQDFYRELIKFCNIQESIDIDNIPLRKRNVGVSSTFQVNLLKRLNEISDKSFLDLYSPFFKKYRITPRDICQERLSNINISRTRFTLPTELEINIKKRFEKDWDFTLKNLSY